MVRPQRNGADQPWKSCAKKKKKKKKKEEEEEGGEQEEEEKEEADDDDEVWLERGVGRKLRLVLRTMHFILKGKTYLNHFLAAH